jgi:hydrogenase maturation protein HypF
MMPDLASVEQHCFVNPDERTLLQSRQRPIVLLKRKPESTIAEEVSPKQNTLGVMLPYTPLHYILFKSKEQFLTAFVMTSGNISEEPIATDNKEAHERLGDLADAFLMHNREIQTRCDDSVLRVTNLKEQETDASQHSLRVNQYMLRRSRGYAPNPVLLPFEVAPILAVGPELKNTFCLTRDRYAFLSHHIGDMENYETLRSFDEGITHFERLFRIQPEAFVHDLHPDYLSTRYALQRAQRENLPTVAVQHHHAHIAACMADNGLDGSMRVIGLSFDGTGYGVDGAIWGGEIFLADYAGFERKFHLAYFPLPGGNAAIMRPARTALALLWSLGLDWDESLASVKDLCFEERQALRVQLERGLNAPQTSSLGRLFDAVAALADVRQQVNYEAQAAMEFESALDETESGMYRFDMQRNTIDLKPVISALLADVFAGVHIPIISARFHNGLTDLARAVCDTLHQETGIREVVLSGGVWQNMALLKRVVRVLRADGFKIYFHQNIPTNDGGLALGQVLAGASQLDL